MFSANSEIQGTEETSLSLFDPDAIRGSYRVREYTGQSKTTSSSGLAQHADLTVSEQQLQCQLARLKPHSR